MTFEFPENDIRMSAFVTDKMLQIGRAMGGKTVAGAPAKRPYNATIYQTTHNTGGAIMGADPRTSVVNRYLQCWDVPNVFVIGASAYPQNATYNPTGTLGALTYWVADVLKAKYLRSPGPLMPT
jgi:gluconate 2-dehydrogenase alpha chain